MDSNDTMGEVEEVNAKDDSSQESLVMNGDVLKEAVEEEALEDAESNALVMEVDSENEQEAGTKSVDSKSIGSVDNQEYVQDTDSQEGEAEEEIIANHDGENSQESNGMECEQIINADADSEDQDNLVIESHEVIDDDEVEENAEFEESQDGENGENNDDDVEMVTQEIDDSQDDDSVEEVEPTDDAINSDGDVQEIDDDEPEIVSEEKGDKNGLTISTIELNDSGEVTVVELPKENGKASMETNIITIDTDDKKVSSKDSKLSSHSPRRSSRNVTKPKNYSNYEMGRHSDESDVEEVLPQDPLAVGDDRITIRKSKNSSTIVVKDTKRLVEIAAKSNPSSGKKEPTLVIIDTNSILSGRGPVPVNSKPSSSSSSSSSNYSSSILPAAVPAQGLYPANMRATITPIPMNQSRAAASPKTVQNSQKNAPSPKPQQAPILPSLTDDMFVVEAPSFIVPYVYEKPPIKELKDFVKDLADQVREQIRKEEEEAAARKKERKAAKAAAREAGETKKDDEEGSDSDDSDSDESEKGKEKEKEKDDKKDDDVVITGTDDGTEKKPTGYFDSPLGKFFIDIGCNLVQEFVQTDLLKQQKRKRDREGGQNSRTNKTIQSLLKSLEYSKENNNPFRLTMKKCEFCSFKTESALAMAFHLETPHMKNYIYRCNFCPFEVRSPHDILFHMDAEHAIRGRLERAPAFHQCPNCPFEDNQKGKLSRHSVACARKFKPELNMFPPIDWEPPAKIPRVAKMKQSGFSAAASMYPMNKGSPYQILPKMQPTVPGASRGRGRPTLASLKNAGSMVRPNPSMVYKQMSGGSVLVPTNYQLSGNPLYQVIGDMGNRVAPGGPMAFVPGLATPSSTVAFQQSQQSNQKKPMHTPSISITPLPRGTSTPPSSSAKPGDANSKSSFVICEICDGYIKDLEQLRNHMQWIHKVKIHPKMIHNRPPLNCQKCQFRFFTDQGLERHLLGSHGLVTSSMQEAANRRNDAGRCPVCGRVYQWKLLNHVARDHNMTLKPAHLSYKCTVCTATFGMYKQFENHVYSAHSVVAKRVMDKKSTSNSNASVSSSSSSKNDSLLKPLKINDEITIIPQAPKANKEDSSTSSFRNGPSTSKST